MSNDARQNELNNLKNTLSTVIDKKDTGKNATAAPGPSRLSGLMVVFLVISGLGLALWLVTTAVFSYVENGFLARTEPFEKQFSQIAAVYATLPQASEKLPGVDNYSQKFSEAKVLIINAKPDANGRLVSRLQYNLPENRMPPSPDNMNLVIRMTLKSDRIYYSKGKFAGKFPIHDFVVDFIDPKSKKIIAQEIVKGDPTSSDSDRNRIHIGGVPVLEAQKMLEQKLSYRAPFCWHQL